MDYGKPNIHPAWAENAAGAPDIVQPTDVEIAAGWPLSPTPPSRGRFNWVLNWAAEAVRYFMQRGLVDYDPAETYRIGSRVIGDDGNTYQSLVNANTGNLPSTQPLKWKRWGFSLDQINASQLTQGNPPANDDSTKVANTHFVLSQIASAIAGYATEAFVLAQGYTTLALVQAWALTGFAWSSSTNGYIKLPTWLGGVIIQWCRGFSSGAQQTVTFPIAFPTNVLTAHAQAYWGVGGDFSTSGFSMVSLSKFNVVLQPNRRTDSSTSATTPYVIAIGY